MTTRQEKRSTRRVSAKRPARIKSIDGIINELDAHTRDLSIRGVFLYLSRKVSLGSTLEVVLPLPEGLGDRGEQWVRCRCRIVRVEQQPQRGEFGVAAMIEAIEPLADSAAAQA